MTSLLARRMNGLESNGEGTIGEMKSGKKGEELYTLKSEAWRRTAISRKGQARTKQSVLGCCFFRPITFRVDTGAGESRHRVSSAPSLQPSSGMLMFSFPVLIFSHALFSRLSLISVL
jgi:hypothetical protein